MFVFVFVVQHFVFLDFELMSKKKSKTAFLQRPRSLTDVEAGRPSKKPYSDKVGGLFRPRNRNDPAKTKNNDTFSCAPFKIRLTPKRY